ncbi:MAG TPA: TonB-dependent receptor [Thermoanaerobaculia bacterium]|nr:TonB-dependent receptor [Thermoanaerobaculia bacterium]
MNWKDRLPGRALARGLAAALVSLALPAALWAGQVRGKVVDPAGAPLPGVTLTLTNDLAGSSQQTVSGADGTFIFYNVPSNPYHLKASLDGFAEFHTDVDVRGSVPVEPKVELTPSFSGSTTVTAEKENVALETEDSSSHVDVDKSLVRRFAAPVASRAFESIVLSAPGFSQDENGRYHFQGGHSQQLLVIDGQPIGDQVGITFSNSLNPAIAEGIEIVTGGIPAEYGEKANGVINVTTRSALGHQGFHGDAGAGAARFSTLEGSAAAGWGGSRSGIFLNLDASKSDRFLDPVSFDNFHNHGNTLRLFGRWDSISASESDSFRLTGNAGKTDRDVPNLPSQEAAGQDQRISSQDWNLNLGYQHVAAAGWVADLQLYGRDNQLRLSGSPNDTPVLADQDRSLQNQGVNLSVSKLVGTNELKIGGQAKRFPIRESFRFGLTDPGFNDPESDQYNPNLAPYDLTRGGALFDFNGERTGTYYAGYAQDTARLGNLTVNAGLRYDHNHLFETESLLQPRVGLAYFIPATKTVLRASYDRMFITPEYENILLSSSAQAAALVPPALQGNSALGSGQLFNVSERHNAYNVGLQQGLGSALRIDLSYWKRTVVNAADQDQFFNTGIVFPLNFKGADLNGWNARLDGGPWNGLRGYLSLGHVHALYENPFVGGLFLDAGAIDTLSGGSFVIDHDQDLQEQLGVFWDIPRSGYWIGVTQRYDSGLVTDAGTLEDVLASPDTAYAAPFIRFNEDPQRVKPRAVWNASLGARLKQYGLPIEVQLDLLNVFDEKGLYNFQSVFGGTHVIPPRTVAGRIRYVF